MANLHPHNNPTNSKRFSNGANTSIGKERNLEKELYYDGRNMRTTSDEGNYGDAERINGEELSYSLGIDTGYVCMAAFFVNDTKVSIWAHTDEDDFAPTIAADDVIVLQSFDFLISLDYPIQYDVNENALGGEFFLTDYHIAPFIFNLQDMIDNIDTEKYFDDFNPAEYQINLNTPVDHPVFVELVNLGGTSGLLSGQHEWAIRYVSATGDKTALTYPTPLVFVPRNYKDTEPADLDHLYPYLKTYGQEPSDVTTAYGAKIKFRVNNIYNYDNIEIIRTSYAGGEGLDFTPTSYIVKKIPISPGEFSIREYVDGDAFQDEPIALTDIQTQGFLSVIKRAKAIRYHNRRVVLGNIEYENFDLEDVSYIDEGTEDMFFPITEDIGTQGMKSAYHHAYHRPLMHSERHGWGIVGFGSSFQTSFVSVLPGYVNYTLPQRRKAMRTIEKDNSTNPVVAADITNTVQETFEVFDLTEAKNKSGVDEEDGYVNIIDVDGVGSYGVRHPISVEDESQSPNGHWFRNIHTVRPDGSSDTDFNPYVFNLKYHSLGMALGGIDNYPEAMKAFSIVRTKRAGRVVCQGIGVYSMTFHNDTAQQVFKDRDSLWFYSPDLYNGVVPPEIYSDIINNFGNYRIILESPLGFTSDVYMQLKDFAIFAGNNHDGCIDTLIYARVLVEQAAKRINVGEAATDVGISSGGNGYVGYGRWRNAAHSAGDSMFGDGLDGDYLITPTDCAEVIEPEGHKYLWIEFNQAIYKVDDANGNKQFTDADVKEWHEPFYIMSIIDDGKQISEDNVLEFVKTEHYQKIEALVGISDGSSFPQYEIVDERPEDFHVETADTTTNKYIYVKDSLGNIGTYINITEKTGGDITIIEDDIDNGTTIYAGVVLSGTFKSKVVDGIYFIYFDTDTSELQPGDYVYVRYDNRFPCKVFGGDTVIHEALFPVLNRLQRHDGDNDDLEEDEEQCCIEVGFPYYEYDMNDDIKIIKDTTTGIFSDGIQDNNGNCEFDYVRQMVVLFTCSSFSHLSLAYNEWFPLVNYVHRPAKWDIGTLEDNNIFEQYGLDYPGEIDRWNYGGFRLNQLPINLDYTDESITRMYFSQPEVGFSEETLFPDLIVWSLQRPINTSIVPALKTFLALNQYTISDKYGEIKKLFDAVTNDFYPNLYVFTENNLCLLITEKSIISGVDGQQLVIQGATGDANFISKEQWLNKPGMPDEVWQFAKEDGRSIFYVDYLSAYKFGEQIQSQNIEGFYRKTLNEVLFNLKNAFADKIGYYDTRYKEYGIYLKANTRLGIINVGKATIKDFQTESFGCLNGTAPNHQSNLILTNTPSSGTYTGCVTNTGDYDVEIYDETYSPSNLLYILSSGTSAQYTLTNGVWVWTVIDECDACTPFSYDDLLVYSDKIQNWNGKYDYKFDYYCSKDQRTFGFRDGECYELHQGSFINGENMDWTIAIVFNPEDWKVQTFVRFLVNATSKPTRVEFLDEDLEVISVVDGANIKDLGNNFEQYINLTDDGQRVQHQRLIMKVVYEDTTQKDVVKSASVQFKNVR